MLNTIDAQWRTFERLVMPEEASDLQRREMRRAFYAGFESALMMNLRVAAESEDAGVAMLEGLHQEARMFARDVATGRA